MNIKTNNNLWMEYENDFPEKYWGEGDFDLQLIAILKPLLDFQNIEILDVGGGCFGTKILKNEILNSKSSIDLLDPFVKEKPSWYREKIDWNQNDKYFDVIISRGAVNYLEEHHFQKINHFLKPGGLFMFNTFLKKPSEDWVEKEFMTQGGEKGIEKSRLNGNKIEHQLVFSHKIIEHFFYYYSLEDYQKFLKNYDIYVEQYKKNSFLLMCKKRKN